jgi:DNA-binding CsgD family transcriptional regulator
MVRNKIAARARKAASLIEANLSRRELAEALGVSYRSIYLTLRRLDIRPSRQKPSAESEQRRIAAVRAVGSVKAAATRERVLALDDAGHSRVEIAVTLGLSTKHVAALLCAAGRKVTEAERIARRWPQYQGRTAADPRQGELPL